jgi:hypothetical protein
MKFKVGDIIWWKDHSDADDCRIWKIVEILKHGEYMIVIYRRMSGDYPSYEELRLFKLTSDIAGGMEKVSSEEIMQLDMEL